MTAGETAEPLGADPRPDAGDTGDALGLPPARLTITFGFGAGLVQQGWQRPLWPRGAPAGGAGRSAARSTATSSSTARTGGDLSIQACADDPQVAFHAVRQLARLAYGAAQLRWAQTGFVAGSAAGDTPRNLMGFKDGTHNPQADLD